MKFVKSTYIAYISQLADDIQFDPHRYWKITQENKFAVKSFLSKAHYILSEQVYSYNLLANQAKSISFKYLTIHRDGMSNPIGVHMDVYEPTADEVENASGRTEKVTINLPLMTLAQIEALVDAGHYQSRAEFLRFASLRELEKFDIATRSPWKKLKTTTNLVIGVLVLTNDSLNRAVENNQVIKIRVVGVLVVSANINLELLAERVSDVKVWGSIKANTKARKIIEQKTNHKLSSGLYLQ